MRKPKSLFHQSKEQFKNSVINSPEVMYIESRLRMFWWKLLFITEAYNSYGYFLPRSWKMATEAQEKYGYLFDAKESVKMFVEEL